MRTPKQKSNAKYQSAPTIQTPKLPSTPEQIRQRAQEIHVARGGVKGIVVMLWKAIRIEIPIGYQDETGFHTGVKPAEKEVKSCRFGSFPHDDTLPCFIRSTQLNKLSAYLMHRRET